jgi:hypothetical protein
MLSSGRATRARAHQRQLRYLSYALDPLVPVYYFFTCRLGVSAQQGKGPSPIVLERFQSVASQLMSQVRMDCDLNFSREVS